MARPFLGTPLFKGMYFRGIWFACEITPEGDWPEPDEWRPGSSKYVPIGNYERPAFCIFLTPPGISARVAANHNLPRPRTPRPPKLKPIPSRMRAYLLRVQWPWRFPK